VAVTVTHNYTGEVETIYLQETRDTSAIFSDTFITFADDIAYSGDNNDLQPPGWTGHPDWDKTGGWYNLARWYEFLYANGNLTLPEGFGKFGGPPLNEQNLSIYQKHFEPNTFPSLLCPSGDNSFLGDGGMSAYDVPYTPYSRIMPGLMRTPLPAAAESINNGRFGYVSCSYSANSRMSQVRDSRLSDPSYLIRMTDRYTYSGTDTMQYGNPACMYIWSTNVSVLRGFMRHSLNRGGQVGKKFVLFHDTHVGFVTAQEAWPGHPNQTDLCKDSLMWNQTK